MRLPDSLQVLRLREFRFVFGASVASQLGDGIVPVALAFAVLDLTHSATDLGVVLASNAVALVTALFAGGVLADRISRRAVMIGADLTRLASQATIAGLLVSGQATVVELALSQAVLGAASGFFNPASGGLLPAVAGSHLREANALYGISNAVSRIGGPALAGLLVVLTGPGVALLIDAASYGASALLLSRATAATPPRAPAERAGFLADMRDGFAEVRTRTWLWATLAALLFLNPINAAFPVLGPLVAKHSLGGAGAWAAILALRAVGGLVGVTSLLRVAPRRPLVFALAASATGIVPTALLGFPAPLVVLLVIAPIAGTGSLVFNAVWDTTLQGHIPERALSRVTSYDWFVSLALAPVGFALVGPVAGAIGTSATLFGSAAIELIGLGALLSVRDVRRLGPAAPAAPAPATAR